ncbi:hypothetical protein [Roseibium sp.]
MITGLMASGNIATDITATGIIATGIMNARLLDVGVRTGCRNAALAALSFPGSSAAVFA